MRIFHLLCALLLVMATVPTVHAVEQEAPLTVTVVDQSGERVSGVDVLATWSGGNTTARTDSQGEVEITAPAGTRVSIEIRDETLVQNIPTVVTATEGGETTIQVAREGSATIDVTTSDGGALTDAAVVLSRDNTTILRGETDDSGAFDTGSLQQGRYKMQVSKAGFYSRSAAVVVNASSTRQVTLEPGTTTIRVRVVDDHYDDPRPLTEASVTIESVGQFTTFSGKVQESTVPVNTDLEIEVSKTGYETVTRTVEIGTTEQRVTVAIQRTPALTMNATKTRLPVNRSTEVRLTNEYGEAVEDATVSVGSTEIGTTDAQGTIELSLPDAGVYNLTATHAEAVSAPLKIKVGVTQQNGTATTVSETARATQTASPMTTTESSGTGPGFTGPLTVFAVVTAILLRRG